MLTRDRCSIGTFVAWPGACAVALAVGLLCAAGGEVARADDGLGIRRLDPETGATVPIAADKLRLGNIYSHFDESLGSREWSHFLGNGQFGIALGQGTTQHARLFDINLLPKDALDLLRRWDPKLAEETVREGTDVFLKLGSNHDWHVVRTTVAMIYDAQTGYRFEQQFGHYIPICHYTGYRWKPDGARFVPAP